MEINSIYDFLTTLTTFSTPEEEGQSVELAKLKGRL